MNALLISGTDTQVGKTLLTMALAAYWQRYCAPRSLGVMKPIETGVSEGKGDRDRYAQQFDLGQSLEEITPLSFAAPLLPPIAAEQTGQKIKLEKVWRVFEALCQQRELVLVEGFGGLGSPLTFETTVADLAWDWRIPTVLVVPVQPGAIAQAVAHAALAQQTKAYLKGIVLNCVDPCTDAQLMEWASPHFIQSLTQKPVLGCLPHVSDVTDLAQLAQLASNLDIERLLPLPILSG